MSELDKNMGGKSLFNINHKRIKILSICKIVLCLLTVCFSNEVYALTFRQKVLMKKFVEENSDKAGSLTIKDVKKALPFMNDKDAQNFLNEFKARFS